MCRQFFRACGAVAATSAIWSVGTGVAFADDDWMYRRSYFSHALPPGSEPVYPLPAQRSAYRPAYYREAFGFSVRSAYRVNNYVIRSGNRTDRTLYQEGYIEFNP
ncbi:MAG: hypothetical protein SH850_26315 [Planctomycetaceae bacterium]|nr:hypothetical protein [Planctomycetaceae bacterium]